MSDLFADLAISSEPGESFVRVSSSSTGGVGSVRGGSDKSGVNWSGPITIGSGIAFLRHPDLLCRGCINNSATRFCIKTVSECQIQSHGTKVHLKPGLFLLDASSRTGTTCFANPTVNEAGLSSDVIKDTLSRNFNGEEARKHLIMLASQNLSNLDEAKDVESKWKLTVDAYKTPKKAKLPQTGANNDTTHARKWEETTNLMEMSTISAESLVKFDGTEGLSNAVKETVAKFADLESYLSQQARDLDFTVEDVTHHVDLLENLAVKVKNLESAMGSHPVALKVEPVIWDALSNIHCEVEALLEEVVKMKKVSTGGLQKTEVEAMLATKEANVLNTIRSVLITYRSSIQSLTSDTTSLKTELAQVKASMGGSNNGGLGMERGMSGGGGATSSAAASMFASLGLGKSAGGPGTNSGTTTGTGTTAGSTNSVAATIVSGLTGSGSTAGSGVPSLADFVIVTNRVENLEAENKARSTQGLSDATRIASHTFTKVEDVELFLVNHGPRAHGVPRFGLFVDPLMLYHWVYARMAGGISIQSDLTTRKKLNIHELELRALESYGSDLPMLFTGKTNNFVLATGGMDKSRLAMLKSYKEFEDAGLDGGFRKKIEATALMIKDSLAEMIDMEFGSHPRVCMLAKEMLSGSYDFITSLNEYMSDTYKNFISLGVGTEKEVWGLVTFVVEQLFKSEFAFKRKTAIGSLEPGCRSSGFRAIWCAIKASGYAKQLVSTGIKDTPSVSASYVRFVLSQSNMGQVGALAEENKVLKRKLEETNEALRDVKKLASDAKKIADSAISKVNAGRASNRNG